MSKELLERTREFIANPSRPDVASPRAASWGDGQLPAQGRRPRRDVHLFRLAAVHRARGPPVSAMSRPWPSRLRAALVLFELKIAGALVLAAVVPAAPPRSGWRATLTEENLAVALNPRVVARLEATPALYGDLFQARKQLYAEQARTLLRDLPADPDDLPAFLAAAVERMPRLRRAAVVDAGRSRPGGGGGARARSRRRVAPRAGARGIAEAARHGLPRGAALECIFAVEARFFADLSEAREPGRGLPQRRRAAGRHPAQLRPGLRRAARRLGAGGGRGRGRSWHGAPRAASRTCSRAVRELARGNLSVQVEPGAARDEVAAPGARLQHHGAARCARAATASSTWRRSPAGRRWRAAWPTRSRTAHAHPAGLPAARGAAPRSAPGTVIRPSPRLLSDAGEIVREEIATLQRLVEEFSGFAKLPEVKPEPAELGEFVEEFVRTNPQLGGGGRARRCSAGARARSRSTGRSCGEC